MVKNNAISYSDVRGLIQKQKGWAVKPRAGKALHRVFRGSFRPDLLPLVSIGDPPASAWLWRGKGKMSLPRAKSSEGVCGKIP
jgi:hypothetical protein